MAADLSMGGGAITVRSRRPVMTLTGAQTSGAGFDVGRDGSVVYPSAAGGGTKLVVVVNWLSEVRRQLRRA